MRRIVLVVVLCTACTAAGEEPVTMESPSTGAPSADAAVEESTDAARGIEERGAAASAVRRATVAVLKEHERAARVGCPCMSAAGEFASTSECVQTLGYSDRDIKCLSEALARLDDATVLEPLECEARRTMLRTDCLERAACVLDEETACYETTEECPPLDPQALTRALEACPDARVLSR